MDFLEAWIIGKSDIKILINMALALIAGMIIAAGYVLGKKKKGFTKSFVITIILLPVVVTVIIPIIASDLKKAVSLAGVFALVRFRSLPGDAKDIFYIFFSLTVGVAIAMQYYVISCVLLFIVTAIYILMEQKMKDKIQQVLKITIPEDMNYNGAFDDIFQNYLDEFQLKNVKTSNMGTLFTLTYKVALKDSLMAKQMIDELRTRNGNLNIILQMNNCEEEGL